MSKNNSSNINASAGNDLNGSISQNKDNKNDRGIFNNLMIQGDNNKIELINILDDEVSEKYNAGNSYGDIEEQALANMREGLQKYDNNSEPIDVIAIFMPNLKVRYRVPNKKDLKGGGQTVYAYTILNICDLNGKLLSDHNQLEIEGIGRYGQVVYPKENYDIPDQPCIVKFSCIVRSYGKSDEIKYGVYITKEVEFINLTIPNKYRRDNITEYNKELLDNARNELNSLSNDDLRIVIQQIRSDINRNIDMTLTIKDFTLNYIISILLLRSKQSLLSRGMIDELIDNELERPELQKLAKCLSFALSYFYIVDYVEYAPFITIVTCYILQLCGIFKNNNNDEQESRFANWVNVCFKSTVSNVVNRAYESCVKNSLKNFKFSDVELQSELCKIFPMIDAINDELKQVKLSEDFNKRHVI